MVHWIKRGRSPRGTERVLTVQREHTIETVKMALLLAAASVILPFAEGVLPFGERLVLAQLPVLLAGLLCGAAYGAAVGAVAPFLSFLITGVPTLYPDAVAVMIEYVLFAAVASVIFRCFARRTASLCASLFAAMVAGRVGYLAAFYVMLELKKQPYSLMPLLREQCIGALPGIILQFIAVPLLVLAAERCGLLDEA